MNTPKTNQTPAQIAMARLHGTEAQAASTMEVALARIQEARQGIVPTNQYTPAQKWLEKVRGKLTLAISDVRTLRQQEKDAEIAAQEPPARRFLESTKEEFAARKASLLEQANSGHWIVGGQRLRALEAEMMARRLAETLRHLEEKLLFSGVVRNDHPLMQECADRLAEYEYNYDSRGFPREESLYEEKSH
jgi:hypothetical protein